MSEFSAVSKIDILHHFDDKPKEKFEMKQRSIIELNISNRIYSEKERTVSVFRKFQFLLEICTGMIQ